MSNHEVNEKIREAIVAGIFYADEPEALQKAIDKVLAAAKPLRDGAIAILTPHAGFAYTGAIQALAWKAACGRAVKRVVMIAPHHHSQGSKIYLPESRFFQSPLGDIPVDIEICDEIESCGTLFEINDIPHLEEHALEVQLPFMKRLFPDATLIPMIADGNEVSAILAVARALDLVLGSERETTLIVVSSNLSSSAANFDSARQADQLLDMICQGDWHGVIGNREQRTSTACGCNAIAQLMACTMTDGTEVSILGRSDSRLQDGDNADRIVHYAAAAWYPGG
ncbi:MAG: AmmeMemoRadiSam system protein B [Spirochaetes bacterium RIFOXYC1_FULL_54_7]|nr:MAG: AmmeMemoRadiSam system protein B [Spirochaetes bacterium RIFOXYC1_FULL_54_7]